MFFLIKNAFLHNFQITFAQINFMRYLLIFSIFSMSFLACKQDGNKQKADNTEAKSGPEYTSKYICPMHCKGSGADTTGVCPACGMDYVVNKDHNH